MVNVKKPLFILSTPGIFPDENVLAIETIHHIAEIGEAEIEIKEKTGWRVPDKWKGNSENQINLDSFYLGAQKPIIGNVPQYDFVLTAKNILSFPPSFVLGFSIREKACIVSLGLLREITSEKMREEAGRQLIYHEAGHLFGMPHRKEGDIEYEMGRHCVNNCSMRQIESIHDIRKFSNERKFSGKVYCKQCEEGLKGYFRG